MSLLGKESLIKVSDQEAFKFFRFFLHLPVNPHDEE